MGTTIVSQTYMHVPYFQSAAKDSGRGRRVASPVWNPIASCLQQSAAMDGGRRPVACATLLDFHDNVDDHKGFVEDGSITL